MSSVTNGRLRAATSTRLSPPCGAQRASSRHASRAPGRHCVHLEVRQALPVPEVRLPQPRVDLDRQSGALAERRRRVECAAQVRRDDHQWLTLGEHLGRRGRLVAAEVASGRCRVGPACDCPRSTRSARGAASPADGCSFGMLPCRRRPDRRAAPGSPATTGRVRRSCARPDAGCARRCRRSRAAPSDPPGCLRGGPACARRSASSPRPRRRSRSPGGRWTPTRSRSSR